MEMDVEKEKKNTQKYWIASNLLSVMFQSLFEAQNGRIWPRKWPRIFTDLDGFGAFPKWCYGRRSSSRFKSYGVSKLRRFPIEK